MLTKDSMSVRNCAKYSALADAGSRSRARSTTDCGRAVFMKRVGACATRIAGSPLGPKCRLKVSQNTPRLAYGLLIKNSGPAVDARPGRTAFRISLSGLDEFSFIQKAHSS